MRTPLENGDGNEGNSYHQSDKEEGIQGMHLRPISTNVTITERSSCRPRRGKNLMHYTLWITEFCIRRPG